MKTAEEILNQWDHMEHYDDRFTKQDYCISAMEEYASLKVQSALGEQGKCVSVGVNLIAKEREEQVQKHGRTIEKDRVQNPNGELSVGASVFCLPDFGCLEEEDLMDQLPDEWDRDICEKIISKPYKERLVIAGALIAAELDRLSALPPPPNKV